MNKEIFLYSTITAICLILLKVMEYTFDLYWLSEKYYIALIALLFLVLGIYFGKENRSTKKQTIEFDREMLPKKLAELGISEREFDVIQKLAEGLSNKQIADQLFLSEHTVKSHLSKIFDKLNASRRTEVLKIARTEGLIR